MTLEPGGTPGYYWHYAQSTFEDGCDVLWRLGVALAESAVSREGVTWKQIAEQPGEQENYATYKFFPAPVTRAGVLALGELPAGLFERLLGVYVETACEYGPDGTQLFSGDGLFQPTAEFEREIGAFIECGYAERCGAMVRWTDRMAPVMCANGSLEAPEPQIKTLSPDVLERVNGLLQDGNPIAAIAVVRKETGAGLFECKAYVDDLVRTRH